MAPHIVSWGGDQHIVSPVPSSTQSFFSAGSIPPDTPESSPGVEEAFHVAESRTNADTPFRRHHKYFFSDGNVTFLVDRTLYCVHRYFFSRDSAYFSTGLAQFDIRDHETLPTIISLDKIERNDFDAFLSVFYPESFEENDRSYEQWKSVLHLSTRWGFASMRKLALATINPPTPYDRLLLARTYSVDHWVVPALSALCEKAEPLTFSEAREMDIGDVVLVATVRENIRSHKLQVDAVDVPHHVEAALEGILGIYPKQSAKEEEAHGISDEQSVSSNSAQRGATTRRTGTEVTVAPKAVSRGREAATVREGAAAPEGEVAVASARGIRVMEAAVVREAVARVEATTANNFLMAAKRRTGLDANVGRFIF